jgi:alkylation response protein AidB-like acyl-CoA dehydrogenase
VDFTPTETQAAVRGVVRDVLDRDPASWKALAGAGLLAVPVPEAHGGEGLGLGEVAVMLHEVAARAETLPVWETLCCGVLTLAAHGTTSQQARLLPEVASGAALLGPALVEPGRALTDCPASTLTSRSGRLVLSGRKTGVTYASDSARLLVQVAVTGVGRVERAVVLLDPHAPGVVVTPTRSSRGEVEATVVLEGVEVAEDDVLGGWQAAEAGAATLRRLAVAGLCLLGDGLVAGARDLTARYVSERQQFGRALAEFQAVSQQMADVYVAARTIGLAATSAAWRLAEGLDADDDLAVAAYWFTREGPAALHVCHHLHGGTGVDVTYPLHRYYAWAKDVARVLGGAHQTLDAVATRLVDATGGR